MKYVGGYETREPKRNPIGEGLASLVGSTIANYGKSKQREEAQLIINDPKSTPIQKAMALASLGHEKLGSDILKQTANQSALQQIQENLARNMGIGGSNPEGRDRSWVPDMSGRTPTIRPNEPVNEVHPGAEPQGTQTQPGFSPGAPAMAARNATALNQPQAMPQGVGVPMAMPQGALAPQQGQIGFEQEAAAYEQAAQEAASIGNHPVATQYANKANQLRKDERTKQEIAFKERQFAVNQNKPFNDETDKIEKSLPLKRQALDLAESAVASGEVGPLSRNNLAKFFNRPELKTASGAALDLAIKTNLISNLSRVSAKGTNLWLEKQLLSAFAATGETQASNMTKLEALKAEKDLDEAQVAMRNQLLEQDLEQYGAEQPYLGRRVHKALEPLEKEIMQKASFRVRKIYENEKGYQKMAQKWNKTVPVGTPLTPEMGLVLLNKTGSEEKAAQLAKQLGYTIYSAEKIKQYEQ